MKDNTYRQELLAKLKIEDADPGAQAAVLGSLEDLANARLANLLPEMLTDEQLAHVDKMQKEGKDEDQIADWIEKQLPEFEKLMHALMMDAADELNSMTK